MIGTIHISGDPSHLSDIVTDDFVCQHTEGNESLAQVLEWATNCSSVLGDYKVIHEDEHSLCGFHSLVSPEQLEKRTKMVYKSSRDGKMALHHCHEIVPDEVKTFVITFHAPAKSQMHPS